MDCPKPFLFNHIKHHIPSIKAYIFHAQQRLLEEKQVSLDLLKIGTSMIDIYKGEYSISKITEELKKHLKSMDCYDEKAYVEFIKSHPKKYNKLQVCDGSEWLLLIGNDSERYIHIHPARDSKHAIRAKATALKTAIYLRIFHEAELCDESLVDLINKVRGTYLGESPIKNEAYTKGVRRVLAML